MHITRSFSVLVSHEKCKTLVIPTLLSCTYISTFLIWLMSSVATNLKKTRSTFGTYGLQTQRPQNVGVTTRDFPVFLVTPSVTQPITGVMSAYSRSKVIFAGSILIISTCPTNTLCINCGDVLRLVHGMSVGT